MLMILRSEKQLYIFLDNFIARFAIFLFCCCSPMIHLVTFFGGSPAKCDIIIRTRTCNTQLTSSCALATLLLSGSLLAAKCLINIRPRVCNTQLTSSCALATLLLSGSPSNRSRAAKSTLITVDTVRKFFSASSTEKM
jgi:hypothetical protein